jgi:hypothetical protein
MVTFSILPVKANGNGAARAPSPVLYRIVGPSALIPTGARSPLLGLAGMLGLY